MSIRTPASGYCNNRHSDASDGEYSRLRYFLKAQKVLHQYEHMPSFHGIQKDCDILVNELKMKLREQFKSKDLEEPTKVLCDEFLKHAKEKLDDDLKEFESHLNYPEESVADKTDEASKTQMGILEFIDFSYNNFVSNTSLVIASYWDLFLQKPAADSEQILATMMPFLCKL
ncbi:Vacuolar protein sorting-associated protein 51 [Araneus ventricosus]|uniref:Vacuolar protein sorting-associated protein 51 homolog n=1 Tax=Araneus ventricosus TaxID=182803 RepID=A0A4Y2MHN6_ARAVE|nr:Vacuolar protein sorting-associated protein 51 [Araneus ventricosus]